MGWAGGHAASARSSLAITPLTIMLVEVNQPTSSGRPPRTAPTIDPTITTNQTPRVPHEPHTLAPMPRPAKAPFPTTPALADDLDARVREVLVRYWGFDTLRPLQIDAIRAGASGRDALVVLPTGGGKSLCYQIPPLLNGKLTVVVSPLISLMKDQVDGLKLANYPAAAIHSGIKPKEVDEVRRAALAGELKLLFVAPERMLNQSFISFMRQADVGAFAIDEAHCISQWGHDFRPEYRRLSDLRSYFPDLAIHAYTATATPRVRQDILDQLALRDPEVLVGIFDRPNLTYRVLPRVSADDQIEEALRRHEGRAAIVYCISRKDTERLAEVLTDRGLKAEAYHAGLSPTTRQRVQDRFANERLNIVVATVAFGMGIDRSDVRCVVHASMPKTVEHYQQETGRAGRDGLPSECVLFYSAADVIRWKQLMERSAADAESPPEPESVQAQFVLLEHMQRVCSSARCRHRTLSEYFGQQYTAPDETGLCGACDVCLNELAMVDDATTIAKKIISCVFRLRQASGISFGAAYVAEVLRGAMIAKVMQRGHEKLSTFGLLRQFDKDRIVSYINQLIDRGALDREPGEFPTLTLGPSASAVLKGEHEVALFDPKAIGAFGPRRRPGSLASAAAAASDAPSLTPDEQGLFESLRSLRRAISDEKGVAAYLIFGDVTLEEMARVRPSSLEQFAHVRGVGTAKLDEFGERFVDNIASYCQQNKLPLDAAPGSRPRRKLAQATASITDTKRASFAMFEQGMSIAAVAAKTGRALSTTVQYLAEWIVESVPETVSPWVDDAFYASIVEASRKLPDPRFKAIFDHFGGKATYEQIRIVITHHKALNGS